MASLTEDLRKMFPRTGRTITYPYTPTYGRREYQEALGDYRNMLGQYNQIMGTVLPQVQQAGSYFAPGGGYGAGQREEAAQAIKSGVARDMAQMVATGMSSSAATSGIRSRAGSELSKLYKNIEDTRAQLQLQALEPYSQIMGQMANMASVRPKLGAYFQVGRSVSPTVTYA